MTGNEERKISSLRDLPLDIAPPRDLWQGIEARLGQGPRAGAARDSRAHDGVEPARRFGQAARMRVFAAAAMIATLAVGIWIGRAVLPGPGKPPAGVEVNAPNVTSGDPGAWHAAYIMDSKYTRERAVLVKDLEARLATLPPESRAKVMSSLQAINDSKRDLEAELGKDPSNALLQELLVNTYQDEMRVLTAVHEAGRAVEGT
ncbi:MAG: hypothetical protein JWO04_4991 [Gammaproteobacteria bacterium]|nr:hypothetical protein [Gammaproteobacteria bacterium]